MVIQGLELGIFMVHEYRAASRPSSTQQGFARVHKPLDPLVPLVPSRLTRAILPSRPVTWMFKVNDSLKDLN